MFKMAAAITSTPKAKVNEPSTNEGGNSFVSFVKKPARGWLHPDHLFQQDGINYNVKVSEVFTSFFYCINILFRETKIRKELIFKYIFV